MVAVNESRRTELDQICRHRGVRRLRMLLMGGSAAREDFTPASDLDFLVEFSGSSSLTDYLGLPEDLKSLFEREVDLVMPRRSSQPAYMFALPSNAIVSCYMQREPAALLRAPLLAK